MTPTTTMGGASVLPTDRPLTADDVPLLREGDEIKHERGPTGKVSRVTGSHIFMAREGLPDIGDFHSGFTFVRRPATSAASEGEGVVSKSDAIRAVDACGGTYSQDEESSGYADGHREALTAALSVLSALPALASPPSERVETLSDDEIARARELREDPDSEDNERFASWYGDTLIRVHEAYRALTAQPAGEGK